LLSVIDEKPSKVLRAVADALDGKLRLQPVRYGDPLEEAWHEVSNLSNLFDLDRVPLATWKKAVARRYKVMPSHSSLRKTAKRRGYSVGGGEPGRPKKNRHGV
jgi:hypothetical protein